MGSKIFPDESGEIIGKRPLNSFPCAVDDGGRGVSPRCQETFCGDRDKPAVNHGARETKFLTHFFLRGVPLHAFQHHFEFELWRITLPFVVHSIQYLSLLLCLL